MPGKMAKSYGGKMRKKQGTGMAMPPAMKKKAKKKAKKKK